MKRILACLMAMLLITCGAMADMDDSACSVDRVVITNGDAQIVMETVKWNGVGMIPVADFFYAMGVDYNGTPMILVCPNVPYNFEKRPDVSNATELGILGSSIYRFPTVHLNGEPTDPLWELLNVLGAQYHVEGDTAYATSLHVTDVHELTDGSAADVNGAQTVVCYFNGVETEISSDADSGTLMVPLAEMIDALGLEYSVMNGVVYIIR